MKLTKLEKQKINKVGRKYNLKLILLHGSYVKCKARPGSIILWLIITPDNSKNPQTAIK